MGVGVGVGVGAGDGTGVGVGRIGLWSGAAAGENGGKSLAAATPRYAATIVTKIPSMAAAFIITLS